MPKKKVLVCGATGFLGRNIAEALAQVDDYEITGTYLSRTPNPNPRIKFVKADLTDRATVEQVVAGKDVVLHYAAITTNFKDVLLRPHIHTTDNIIMTSLLIRTAHDMKVPHF